MDVIHGVMSLKELSEVDGKPNIVSIWVHHKFCGHGMKCTIKYNKILWAFYKKTKYYEEVEVHNERFNIKLVKFHDNDQFYHGVEDAVNRLKAKMLNKNVLSLGHYTYNNDMFDYTHSDIIDEFDLLAMGYHVIATYGEIMVYGSEIRNDMYVVIPDIIIGKRIPVYVDSRDNVNTFTKLMSRVSFVNNQ